MVSRRRQCLENTSEDDDDKTMKWGCLQNSLYWWVALRECFIVREFGRKASPIRSKPTLPIFVSTDLLPLRGHLAVAYSGSEVSRMRFPRGESFKQLPGASQCNSLWRMAEQYGLMAHCMKEDLPCCFDYIHARREWWNNSAVIPKSTADVVVATE
ncbi:hypothetical protein EGR_09384 [Echinococcus granulosus]|uniref:Uncharacterized protein n=1 Tax=Echinococcus granulosus TaxID=6210 RepID=W6U597_ECHGR|nr:hypothetical protein EGR_09384 [Echinococcus granulosus]EUB55726.1 hypothetical protein EGR_09384 [Echinococcus granulosus]